MSENFGVLFMGQPMLLAPNLQFIVFLIFYKCDLMIVSD